MGTRCETKTQRRAGVDEEPSRHLSFYNKEKEPFNRLRTTSLVDVDKRCGPI